MPAIFNCSLSIPSMNFLRAKMAAQSRNYWSYSWYNFGRSANIGSKNCWDIWDIQGTIWVYNSRTAGHAETVKRAQIFYRNYIGYRHSDSSRLKKFKSQISVGKVSWLLLLRMPKVFRWFSSEGLNSRCGIFAKTDKRRQWKNNGHVNCTKMLSFSSMTCACSLGKPLFHLSGYLLFLKLKR